MPPHLRGTNTASNFKTKLHEDDEKPDKILKAKSSGADDLEKKIKIIKKVGETFEISALELHLLVLRFYVLHHLILENRPNR